ncbi:hypothetical protein MPLB_1890008 [Mesorhizobium sp. ORS 3324]|nr:hypothetical protein MPLB_1890008 [Mesorhizobium sp. ORS 3324]
MALETSMWRDAYEIVRTRAGHWQRVEHGKSVETVTLDNTNPSPSRCVCERGTMLSRSTPIARGA